MEDSTVQDGDPEYLLFSVFFSFLPCLVTSPTHDPPPTNPSPGPSFFYLFPPPVAVIPEMGRPSWALPHQRDYLASFLPLMSQAKGTTTLETLYVQVYESYLKKWAPEPFIPEPGSTLSPQELEEKARMRLKKVSVITDSRFPILTAYQRIANWFKGERKKQKHAAVPYTDSKPRVLNLSGNSKRKKPPYQLYQAYSICYWRPDGSPLRQEVEDLWARRTESSVQELLRPFFKDTVKASTSTSQKLLFHVAVMRWKCSLLGPDELAVLNDWIGEQAKSKEAARALPWMTEAAEHGDDLFAENTYIQRFALSVLSSKANTNPVSSSGIDDLARTVQVAIEEIERQTGWKSMVILGGLEPRGGKITSHLSVFRFPPFLRRPHFCIDTQLGSPLLLVWSSTKRTRKLLMYEQCSTSGCALCIVCVSLPL